MQKIIPDLSPLFVKYKALAADVDTLFSRVKSEYPDAVTCHVGCSDCCSALFDLPLIEAVYLNHSFNSIYPHGALRSAILEKADAADRAVHKIKRKAYKDGQAGVENDAIFKALGQEKIRCPLLSGESDPSGTLRCSLYEHRPLTCRLYGIPTAIGGTGHTCALSAFSPGKNYPTIKMDQLHARMASLSFELARHVKSGYSQIHTVLVPVSMALLTEYNTTYFGVGLQSAYNEREGENG